MGGMTTLLSYLLFRVENDSVFVPAENGKDDLICGKYSQESGTLSSIRGRYKTAAEWFVNQPFKNWRDVKLFTDTYGLLRANWTHGGWGGDKQSDQFELPVDQFLDYSRQFREHFLSRAKGPKHLQETTEWLSKQLGQEPELREAETFMDMSKLSQSRIGIDVKAVHFNKKFSVQLELVFGDLWQALCYELSEILGERRNLIRVCRNCGRRFVTTRKNKEFCDLLGVPAGNSCAKLYANREWAERKRARLKRKKSLR